MRRLGSLILASADTHRVPAGAALPVDLDGFSAAVTAAVPGHPPVEVRRELVDGLPPEDWGRTIIATGPLTAPPLAQAIRALTGEERLAFFDPIAPLLPRASIDMDTPRLD